MSYGVTWPEEVASADEEDCRLWIATLRQTWRSMNLTRAGRAALIRAFRERLVQLRATTEGDTPTTA